MGVCRILLGELGHVLELVDLDCRDEAACLGRVEAPRADLEHRCGARGSGHTERLLVSLAVEDRRQPLGEQRVAGADDRHRLEPRRDRPVAPDLPVSVVGAGDALLAQWMTAILEGQGNEDALRLAAAAGAASVLEVGAGRFDPAEAKRLLPAVEVHELTHV